MTRLSAILIVKNEGENLAACLSALTWTDELIVCDSGSTDDTLDIAARYGAKILRFDDWPGFGIQRQRAQAAATGDWILMIDADERVTPLLREEIATVISVDDRSQVCALPRLTWAFGRFIRYGGWYPDYVVRLYPRTVAGYDDALVHEKVVVNPPIRTCRLNNPLLHFTYRDLYAYLTKSAMYARAWAEQRHARGQRASLGQGFGHALSCFVRMYLLRLGFLDGRAGLLLALLSSHSTFVKYADLWVRRQHPPMPENNG